MSDNTSDTPVTRSIVTDKEMAANGSEDSNATPNINKEMAVNNIEYFMIKNTWRFYDFPCIRRCQNF